MIKTRKPIQSPTGINFLSPKSPKTFVKKLKEWLKKVTKQ